MAHSLRLDACPGAVCGAGAVGRTQRSPAVRRGPSEAN